MNKLENDPRLQDAMRIILQCELEKEDEYIKQIKQDTTPVPDTLLDRLKELLDDYYKRDRARRKKKHILLIAAVLAALLLGACVAIEPLREFIFGAIVTKHEEYFDFKWQNASQNYDVSNSPEIPRAFDYIPEGYELVEEEHIPEFTYYIEFKNLRNDRITYTVNPKWSEPQYDINFTISLEKINEIDVIVLKDEKELFYQLLWSDEYYSYRLNGFANKEELIKMLESLS